MVCAQNRKIKKIFKIINKIKIRIYNKKIQTNKMKKKQIKNNKIKMWRNMLIKKV